MVARRLAFLTAPRHGYAVAGPALAGGSAGRLSPGQLRRRSPYEPRGLSSLSNMKVQDNADSRGLEDVRDGGMGGQPEFVESALGSEGDEAASVTAPTRNGSPRSAWYVVARSEELRGGRSLQVRLLGEDLRLSRRDGAITAQQQSDARSVAVQEAHGLIWLCLGQVEAAPALPELVAGARMIGHSVVKVRSDFDQAVLGLVDPAHVPMVHRSWWWRPPSKGRRIKTKAYTPSPFGFTARAVDAFASAPIYDAVGRQSVEIEFRLPSVRNETIIGRALRLSNLTVITPLDDDHVMIRNLIYADRPSLRLLAPLLSVAGTIFLGQDAAILRRLHREQKRGRSTGLFVGDPDKPSLWYYQLKAAHQAFERGRARFTNPVRSAILRWNTCWLLCLPAPL